MALIKIFKDKLGEILYPITKTSAVYAGDGKRLDTELSRAAYHTVVDGETKLVDQSGAELAIEALPKDNMTAGNVLLIGEDGQDAVWTAPADTVFVTDEELDSKGYVVADDADLTETESGELATVEYIESQNYVSETEMNAAIQTAITGALEALY